jgi:hypothetical protein
MGGRRTDVVGKLLLTLGFGLIALTWAMGTPANSSPDEVDHYVRALAVAHGEVHGAADPRLTPKVEATEKDKSCCGLSTPTAFVWVLKGNRVVEVPAHLAPARWRCVDAKLGRPESPCDLARDAPTDGQVHWVTSMGTVEPIPYLLPGLSARLAPGPGTGLRMARVANVMVGTLLLGAAVWALWPSGRRSAASIAGLLVAASPALLFVVASPAPSAIELASGVAFTALLLKVVRPDADPTPMTWVGLGLTGFALATSRSLGPVWIVLDVLAVLALAGWRQAWTRLRAGGRWAIAAIALVCVGGLSTVLWEITAQPGVRFDGAFFWDQLDPSWKQLPDILREAVGSFGWVEIWMSDGAYATWAVAAAALLLVALVVGRWRDRLLTIALVGVPLLAALLISAAVLRQNGFGLQARHVLALAVTAPLLLGEIVARRTDRLPRWLQPTLLVLVVVTTVSIQVVALFTAAEHYSLVRGHQPASWQPPGSTATWVVVAIVGALSLSAGAMLALRDRSMT